MSNKGVVAQGARDTRNDVMYKTVAGTIRDLCRNQPGAAAIVTRIVREGRAFDFTRGLVAILVGEVERLEGKVERLEGEVVELMEALDNTEAERNDGGY